MSNNETANAAADPWWLQPCKDNIAKIPGGTLCTQDHCTEAQQQNHMICYCQAPYLNGCSGANPPPNCCSYSATSPVFVALPNGGCYCCCGCFAFDTPVSVSETETKPIYEIQIGDQIYVAEDSSLSKWGLRTVQFSSGTGPISNGSVMIRLVFGTEEKNDVLYVTQNQVFYQPGGKLIRANKLVPGVDVLVHADSSTVPILELTVGQYELGIHHVATTQTIATSMDGHLILAKGIVAGDYALQIINDPKYFVDDHENRPEFGTKEYLEAYRDIPEATTYRASAIPASKQKTAENDREDGVYRETDKKFTPFGEKGNASIPGDVHYFVHQQQAEDILKNAPQSPISSGAGTDIYNYLVKFFRGFYPEIVFYLDNENELPNAYSFNQLGVPFIVINGGLIRTKCVYFELLALVIAHEIGHLYGGDPKAKNGYTCEGMADFAAISAIFPYVWFGYYSYSYRSAAIAQVQTFFDFINPENRNGIPGNRCNYISIDCRMQSMNNAASSKLLPYCAGGPADPFLEVTGASAVPSAVVGQPAEVTISFNVAVDEDTALSIGNYLFAPRASAYSVVMVPGDPTKVMIGATIMPDVEYKVTVFNVLSAKDEPLVPGKNQATFTMAGETPPAGSSISGSKNAKK